MTLGWVRWLATPPGYELTCRGEEVYRDELDEVTAGSGKDDDYDWWEDGDLEEDYGDAYDFDYYDDEFDSYGEDWDD
jgi:hypothetical protein